MQTPTEAEAETPRFRGRFPFRFWFFGPATTLIVLAVGFRIGVPVYRQQLATQAIEKAGGAAFVELSAPDWLARCISRCGLSGVGQVRRVDFTLEERAGGELDLLRDFDGLEELVLDMPDVSNADLTRICQFKKLRCLDINASTISDAGLEHLSAMTTLEELYLTSGSVTDAGLVHLDPLINLKELMLTNTDVTQKGLDRLQYALPGTNIRNRNGIGCNILSSGIRFTQRGQVIDN